MFPRRLRNAGVVTICVGVLAVILIVLRQTQVLGFFSKSLRRATSTPVEFEVAGILVPCGAGVVVLGIVMVVVAAALQARAGAGPDAGMEQGEREGQPVGDKG
ncbi:hypothetical protein ACFYY8_41975 [Streptosporangium sp. NPDC001559]|uniref:hypothetical protein n=1 Tax=Streptosporangium sp. NPDC001559 TaxID=3366187 RepID=UPI0036ECC892